MRMRYIRIVDFITLSITLISAVTYVIFFDSISSSETTIVCLSILGWIELLFCLTSMKRKCGHFFTIYSIFIVFAFLFTYGQCLLWAFGIHIDKEIGRQPLYSFAAATNEYIVKTQLLTLMGLMAFHCGSIITYKNNYTVLKSGEANEESILSKRTTLKQVVWLCNIVSSPLMFYSVFRSIAINRIYGYGAVLNNIDVVSSQNNIVMLLRLMYIPSLFGILISEQYSKRSIVYCYTSFAIFMIIGMLAGDRGEWLFPLILLVWMHHKYSKKIRLASFLKYLIIGFVLIVFSVAIRNSRDQGVTVNGVMDALVGESNPIISALFELGGSMRPGLILMQYGWDKYPYGNSYLLSIVGMITEKPLALLIPGYKSLSRWFSSNYLGIKYGAGFSFLAEALANYGPFFSLIAMFIIGVLFTKLMFFTENIDYEVEPIKSFFGLATAYAMIQSIRNTMLVSLKYWVYSTISILVMYYMLALINKHRAG